jgi:hypothetical protein
MDVKEAEAAAVSPEVHQMTNAASGKFTECGVPYNRKVVRHLGSAVNLA